MNWSTAFAIVGVAIALSAFGMEYLRQRTRREKSARNNLRVIPGNKETK